MTMGEEILSRKTVMLSETNIKNIEEYIEDNRLGRRGFSIAIRNLIRLGWQYYCQNIRLVRNGDDHRIGTK